MKVIVLLFLLFVAFFSSAKNKIAKYPRDISPDCRDGVAKIYDECSDQKNIIKMALLEANSTNKTVLLVYGAEWCIWCHVFDKYIDGQRRKYVYEWQYDNEPLKWKMYERGSRNIDRKALDLNKYVSDNFVVAYIEADYSPNGAEAIEGIGVNSEAIRTFPFFFSIDSTGQYAGHMQAYNSISGLEKRTDSGREYRGFDRVILLGELKKLRSAAMLSDRQLQQSLNQQG
ncbi:MULTISPECIES: hypothetical protein [Pseudoalteromonas]|uniref:hypothetical protein n=1 Tax=Pseudoalteromonas TaxID=53246 RepID=UPI000F7A803E|nr:MULTISPECIES: hypothetical protein [Pseudoalteromonas]MCG7562842.1 thioredoxin family protein [Pseudoalteromonas sp. McH1-42]MEC4089179.1 hypothetical protein [Pseudoalteromonas rubra]